MTASSLDPTITADLQALAVVARARPVAVTAGAYRGEDDAPVRAAEARAWRERVAAIRELAPIGARRLARAATSVIAIVAAAGCWAVYRDRDAIVEGFTLPALAVLLVITHLLARAWATRRVARLVAEVVAATPSHPFAGGLARLRAMAGWTAALPVAAVAIGVQAVATLLLGDMVWLYSHSEGIRQVALVASPLAVLPATGVGVALAVAVGAACASARAGQPRPRVARLLGGPWALGLGLMLFISAVGLIDGALPSDGARELPALWIRAVVPFAGVLGATLLAAVATLAIFGRELRGLPAEDAR